MSFVTYKVIKNEVCYYLTILREISPFPWVIVARQRYMLFDHFRLAVVNTDINLAGYLFSQ